MCNIMLYNNVMSFPTLCIAISSKYVYLEFHVVSELLCWLHIKVCYNVVIYYCGLIICIVTLVALKWLMIYLTWLMLYGKMLLLHTDAFDIIGWDESWIIQIQFLGNF